MAREGKKALTTLVSHRYHYEGGGWVLSLQKTLKTVRQLWYENMVR